MIIHTLNDGARTTASGNPSDSSSGLTSPDRSPNNTDRDALGIAATAILLAAFVGIATNIAIPVLEDEFFDASLPHISWVISALLVT